MCDRRYMRDKDIIELTAEMILKEQEFGQPICTRPTAKELGQALLKANKLGLRVIKGGNRCAEASPVTLSPQGRCAKSEDVAKVLVNKLGL